MRGGEKGGEEVGAGEDGRGGEVGTGDEGRRGGGSWEDIYTLYFLHFLHTY